jgi:hypothetical protein
MPSLIDWYLVELRHLLDDRIPSDHVDSIVCEAESHLRESVRTRISADTSEEEASRAAIEAYGKPERVAAAFFQGTRQKVLGINPGWWAAASSIIAIWCWNFEWMTFRGAFDIFGDSWQPCLVALVGVLALAVLTGAVQTGLRSYRLCIGSIALGVVALATPLMSFWIIPGTSEYQGISRFHLSRDASKVDQTISKLGRYGEYVNRGLAAYAAAKSLADLPAEFWDADVAAHELTTQPAPGYMGRSGYVPTGGLPTPNRWGAMAMVDGRIWALNTAGNFASARADWLKNGPKALAELPREKHDLGVLLGNARAAQNGRLFFPEPRLGRQVVVQTLELLPVLLLVDWLAVASVTRRRRWERKRLLVA